MAKDTKSLKKVSPLALANNLTEIIIGLKEDKRSLKSWLTKSSITCIFLALALGVSVIKNFETETLFFSTDAFGRVIPIKGFQTPHLTQEKRIQLAELIVRSLNSLDFVDYKEVLSNVEKYFDPNVFKGYMTGQMNNGFFDSLEKFNVTYIASVEPARIVGNTKSNTSYSDPGCYELKFTDEGKPIQTDCREGNLSTKRGHSETYEFKVKRRVYVNAVDKGIQELRIKIVITRVSLSRYSQGYIVSEYTEYLTSDI